MPRTHEILEIVQRKLARIERKVNYLMATLADVQAAVTAEDSVIDSAVALIQGLAAQIAALAPNQAAIDALAADVQSKSDALAAAVAANTPAATPPSA
jgi:prefoldin subunit 5